MKRRFVVVLLVVAALAGTWFLVAPDLVDDAWSFVRPEPAPDRASRTYGFEVTSMTTIRVEAANIDIRISASDAARTVSVETFLTGQAADDDLFVVEGTIIDSTTLYLRALPTADWSSQEPGGGRMIVTLPRKVIVAVASGRGSVLVAGLDGEKKLNVSDGDVAIVGGSGSFRVRAPRGNVALEQYNGSGSIEGGNGRIRTSIVEGRVAARCEGGIEVRGHLGSVDLSSRGGGIAVEILRLDSASTVSTMSGNIHLHISESLAALLSIVAAPAHLDIANARSLLADTSGTVMPVPLNGGGPPLRIESVQGWVKVEG